VKAYKGFNEKLQCNNFQFELGKTYEEPVANLCNRGFHACENPLDVFGYYSPVDSRYCEVELDEVSIQRSDDSKVCAKKITIGAEVGIRGIVNAAVNLIIENTKQAPDKTDNKDYAQIGSSGYGAQIGSSGNGARIGSSGYGARIKSEGRNSVVMCAGDGCSAKGKKGSWLALSEWKRVNGEYTPICVKAVQIDGESVKEDTFYKLVNGEFVEA